MNFSAWSIRNPIAPILLFFMLVYLGVKSFYSLPITRFPNIDVPVISVVVSQSGSAPAELELQVTKEIEDAVASLTGVDEIQSTVTDGNSQTAVIFRTEIKPDDALKDVKDAVDRIRSSLPAAADEPIVSKIDVEGQAILSYAVSAPDMTLEEVSWFVDDTVKRALQGKPGIGKVDRYGGVDREVRVELNPDKLNAYGISAADVNTQLRGVNTDVGSGRGQVAGVEQSIRTLGDSRSVTDLANTTIAIGNGRFVKLAELGTITDTYEEPKSFSRFNGDPVVSFAIFRSKGASEVSVAETVNEALTKLKAENPHVSIEKVDDAVYFTYGNYESALHTLMEGAILAVIVVFLFLRNWRATLISAVALPLSAIPTFWIMESMGFSLNLVSFLALTLATGILVDDAIVEIENIARHIKMGKTPYRAALDAADEIGLAVIATSFTIIAVFVPVSFMPGIPGKYFIQFGLTVAFSVFFSLMVARLITPLMAAYLMRTEDAMDEHHGEDGPLMTRYLNLIHLTTRWRYTTLLAAIGFLVVSVMLMLSIPGSFLPPEDAGRITLSVELPPNASLEETSQTADALYQRLHDIDGVETVFVLGGSSPKGDLELRRASVTLNLVKIDHSLVKTLVNKGLGGLPLIGPYLPKVTDHGRIRPQWDIEKEVFARIHDLPDVRIIKLNDRGERDLSFNFLGKDNVTLAKATGDLEAALRTVPELANVSAEGALPRPELQIHPRKDEAARLGVTPAQIAQTVRVATIGDTDVSLAKIALDGRLIPIRVQASLDLRRDLAALRAMKIATSTGTLVPLSAVADIDYAEGVSSIKRNDRARVISIGASLPQGVALDPATEAFKKTIDKVGLPDGVRIAESGDAKIQGEMVQSFGNAMMMGLLLVLIVLILLFKDVIQPFTILFSLPLAIGGVAAALFVTNSALSMPVLIGMLMLMGIVTKNAILLIDFAIEMIRGGMDRTSALIEAGHKRARPIIMTSIAMSAGMLPSALGVGEGGSFRAPMAIAVMGGILVSTVLSLVVVPSFFLIMDDLSWLLGRLFSRFVGSKDENDTELSVDDVAQLARRNEVKIDALASRLHAIESTEEPVQKHDNVAQFSTLPRAAE
ncbi:MAG: efflux RND transporter permease subunit [Proteobacteria bacterium]|nr:efflux RND transporter permease subunit [Pseudomonadota bacterium]